MAALRETYRNRDKRLLFRVRLILWGFLAFVWFRAGTDAAAQGTFFFTGQGETLVTRRFVLDIGSVAQPVVTFNFGFASDEAVTPGAFLDSFSVSAVSGNIFAQLVTADATGFLWAPPGTDGYPLNGASIVRSFVSFPDTEASFKTAQAYTVSWAVPEAFGRGSLELFFDLFDNLDQNNSVGFFTTPIVVPEPSSLALLGMGSLIVLWRLRRC